jgi:ArsR family transcriptional regulator
MAKLETIQGLDQHQTITRDEIMARLHDRALAIVNVLPADSFKAGHIPGSLNLPIADIQAKARQLLSNLHQEIAIYCAGPT